MRLRVEFNPGDDIRNASEDAQCLADRLGVTVDFKFNTVTCIASPGGTATMLADEFMRAASGKGSPPKLAFSTHSIFRGGTDHE